TVFSAGPVIDTAKPEIKEDLDLFSLANEQVEQTTEEIASQLLEITAQSDKKYDIELTDLSLSDRTSNGQMIADELDSKGIKSINIK
ncbi:MAG: hypothetical protein FWE43_04185, partial [Streptococcaceae bacterium]|nr:hypothetical protein [Streptococcaceae bacterium]